ncbi:META domain-containing protein [Nostoc sp.]|uniref:META domain-containing protein n=1 Tax=Nostoc sp. TaxID=1180 RepID=UPI002FEF10A3
MKVFKYIKKAIVFALVVFSLSLALQSPSYAAGLEGKWKLTSLNDSSVPEEVKITATFDPNQNRLEGSVDTGFVPIRYFGSYESTDNTIQAPGVVRPRVFIGNEAEEYFSTLSSAQSYDVKDQKLTISDYSGRRKLSFVKAE